MGKIKSHEFPNGSLSLFHVITTNESAFATYMSLSKCGLFTTTSLYSRLVAHLTPTLYNTIHSLGKTLQY